jgi:hypothetical protein
MEGGWKEAAKGRRRYMLNHMRRPLATLTSHILQYMQRLPYAAVCCRTLPYAAVCYLPYAAVCDICIACSTLMLPYAVYA